MLGVFREHLFKPFNNEKGINRTFFALPTSAIALKLHKPSSYFWDHDDVNKTLQGYLLLIFIQVLISNANVSVFIVSKIKNKKNSTWNSRRRSLWIHVELGSVLLHYNNLNIWLIRYLFIIPQTIEQYKTQC